VEIKSMEVKKSQPTIATPAPTTQPAPFALSDVSTFVGDVKEELRKISWTSPDELRVYTQITIGATLVLGLGIYFIDILIQLTLMSFSNVVRFIFG
jgi:preprotein translocase subunit SecE